ncbi:uncharacterized protein BT62DRAFT_245065 [Guyanagaster necrorhizus]|uniref:Uncharacterized protein n=1 Tax=Guyanagaster necrorhizus TaxID=856835 RepID=A0A9P7VQ77_9AGAR|nr:uncharacterized protein BT62DRAFT_245065 [Guyanagaster necrorhizus MCA 3950]KAG7444465.1 hypothetical protein BT62DRAFT_245065 [Guyanagaster necrorhizus MCA 3950]
MAPIVTGSEGGEGSKLKQSSSDPRPPPTHRSRERDCNKERKCRSIRKKPSQVPGNARRAHSPPPICDPRPIAHMHGTWSLKPADPHCTSYASKSSWRRTSS